MTDLDQYERKIIRELQRDSSLTMAELAERIGLSPSPAGAESTGWSAMA